MYKPIFPKDIKAEIGQFTNTKLPAFFEYAKDKDKNQVVERNNSFVNRIYDLIPNSKLNFSWVDEQIGKFDYKKLKHNQNSLYTDDELIKKYNELEKMYMYKINLIEQADFRYKDYGYVYNHVRHELSRFGYSDRDITDMLIEYLYGGVEKRYKNILWCCYGNYIVMNLKNNVNTNGDKMKIIQCVDCGEFIEVPNKDTMTCRCYYCNTAYRREYLKQKQREHRAKTNVSTDQNQKYNNEDS